MKKEIGGKTYVQVPELVFRRCTGCVARSDDGSIGTLCYALGDECSVNRTIWKQQTMSEKTALELVDELIAMMGCPPPGQLIKLKSAIERERGEVVADIQRLQVAISQNQAAFDRTIHEMNDRLKSAIVMRPISELPYNVPDGCVIVAVGKLRVTIKCWVWEPGDDAFPHEGETHFYILPLPKTERRLHPCYMPGCGNEVVVLRDGEDGYRVECRKCGSTGPLRASKEGAEQSWGYAE